jgi:hypothetical protein
LRNHLDRHQQHLVDLVYLVDLGVHHNQEDLQILFHQRILEDLGDLEFQRILEDLEFQRILEDLEDLELQRILEDLEDLEDLYDHHNQ